MSKMRALLSSFFLICLLSTAGYSSGIDSNTGDSEDIKALKQISLGTFLDSSHGQYIEQDGKIFIFGSALADLFKDCVALSLSPIDLKKIKRETSALTKPPYILEQYIKEEYNSKEVIIRKLVVLFKLVNENENFKIHGEVILSFRFHILSTITLQGRFISPLRTDFWNTCCEASQNPPCLLRSSLQKAFAPGTNRVKDEDGLEHKIEFFSRCTSARCIELLYPFSDSIGDLKNVDHFVITPPTSSCDVQCEDQEHIPGNICRYVMFCLNILEDPENIYDAYRIKMQVDYNDGSTFEEKAILHTKYIKPTTQMSRDLNERMTYLRDEDMPSIELRFLRIKKFTAKKVLFLLG